MSAAASSIACAPPWPMNGSIGWQASPSMVTRPYVQRVDRLAVEHRPDEGLVDRVDDALHLRVPARIGRAQVGDACPARSRIR